MNFGASYMSGLLWLVPVIFLFFLWVRRHRDSLLTKFADRNVLAEISKAYDPKKRKLKNAMLLAALFFIVIAFLRPQWGYTLEEIKRQGLDIMIALDTSNSMLARDVLPNRLERSRLAIKDLIGKLKGDRIGLIAFSGTAFLQCPLTLDYNGFLLTLDDVETNTIPVGGTSLSNAIYTAINSYEGGRKKHKILIVITDGEDLEGGVEKAVAAARSAGVVIYCVGIGTTEGELIPLGKAGGAAEFLKDDEGKVVKTRLDENTLQKIALGTGGMYVRSTGAEFGLDLIYEKKLEGFEKEELKSRTEKKYHERFQIPLAIAFLLLAAEPLVGYRREDN